MRLIDADEAKRFVEENPNNLFIKGFFGVIDELPTAYDVENVVLELKKQSFKSDFGDWMLDADEAIEIVKSVRGSESRRRGRKRGCSKERFRG